MPDQAPPPHEDPSTPRPLGPLGTRALVTFMIVLAIATAAGSAYFLVSAAESAMEDDNTPADTTQVEQVP